MALPHWPLFDLTVRTPDVELRPPDGVRQRHSLQYYWRCWASFTPDEWQLPFAVWSRHGGGGPAELVGVQTIMSSGWLQTRTFETGSWVQQAFQGRGIGKEMRAAVLHFAFDGLGALRATTAGRLGGPPARRHHHRGPRALPRAPRSRLPC
jgi:RimJ/RimL family protein N-acetyltransferase